MVWKYLGSHKEDIVLDVVDASGDDGQRHAGENVSIITLTRIECLAIVSYWQERRTTSKNSFSLIESINQFKMWFDFFKKVKQFHYVSIFVSVFGSALGFASRVAKSEDDWAIIK